MTVQQNCSTWPSFSQQRETNKPCHQAQSFLITGEKLCGSKQPKEKIRVCRSGAMLVCTEYVSDDYPRLFWNNDTPVAVTVYYLYKDFYCMNLGI